jgi:UDP-N-acetyl-D-mannosaminuronic acid dehydrogenase
MAGIVARESGLDTSQVHFAHAPARVLPGKVLREIVENDRIIGGIDDASTQVCVDFYSTFVSGEIHTTTARAAETAKLVENAYRDVNIAFANELSLLADELGLDVWELIRLANRHPRVNILSPGCGVGGHCIAVDPWFLVNSAPAVTRLIRTAREVNDHKPEWVVERVKRKAARFKRPKIACLGLAYKPDIDDLRESPAVHIVEQLLADKDLDADVMVVEPYVSSHASFPLVQLDKAIADADIILMLTAHKPFKKISPTLLAEKILIDACGALRPA